MTRAETWVAAALTAAVLAPLWLVDHPPLQDYPYHLVRAHILAHHDDPAFGYGEVFEVSWYPAPYVLTDWLVAGLGRFVGVPLAGKLVVSLYLVLFPWSLIYLARGVGEGRGVLGFLGFLLALNWHFHMGFVSYVLSLPSALFALGWWWRRRRKLTWGPLAVLALLALVTYLLHVYAFGVLAFALGVLAILEGRRAGGAWRLLARTWAAFLPALGLLAGAAARAAERSGGEQGPLLLLYGNLRRKVLLALGALPSFSLAWETALFAAGVATAGVLAVLAWRRGRRPAASWLAVAGALAVLYLLLPDHVGRVFFVSNRVPLFVLMLGLVALPVPEAPRARMWALAVFAALAVAHVSVLAHRYVEIDRRLADYEAALAALPAEARVAFRVDKASMAEGRIAPAALFGGYHYLKAPGARIPDLEHFVGTLRTVSYRDQGGRSLSTASVGSEEELSELLSRPWLVGPGGLLLIGGKDTGGRVAEAAARSGFRELLAGPRAALYRKARKAPPAAAEDPVFATGYAEGYDYLVVYRAPKLPAREPAPGLSTEPVLEAGWAAVYRRSTASPAAGESGSP